METGDILLQQGLLTEAQLTELRELQRSEVRSGQRESVRLDQLAVRKNILTEEAVLTALGRELRINYVDLPEYPVDLSLLKTFPTRFIHREFVRACVS